MSGRLLRFTEAEWRDQAAKRHGWTTRFSPPLVGEANARDVNGNAAGSIKRKPSAGPSSSGACPAAKPPPEAAILKACIRVLALDSRVAWATRMNSGAYVADGRYVRFGFKGCADIIGQMADGRFLAIEVKRAGGRVSEDQLAFLGRVKRAGGVAFVAWSVDDIGKGLA